MSAFLHSILILTTNVKEKDRLIQIKCYFYVRKWPIFNFKKFFRCDINMLASLCMYKIRSQQVFHLLKNKKNQLCDHN